MTESAFHGFSFIIIESAGLARAGNVYQIQNPSGDKLATVIEEIPRFFKKLLKFTPLKTLLAFNIIFYDIEHNKIIRLQRSFTFFLSKVYIYNDKDELLGCFKQKFKWIIAKFDIFNSDKKHVATLKGDWRDWKFKIFRPDNTPVGAVNKKWAGIIKEVFTTADKYLVELDETASDLEKIIALASSIIIDLVLKEYT